MEPGVHREDWDLWNGESAKTYEVFTFVPRKYSPGAPAPLMLALHGSDGKGDEVYPWWQPAAEELGMVVVAPTDPKAKNGYTFTEAERAAGLSALRAARRKFNIDENRIFVSGFSRGGHMSWDLALRHPDLFAAMAPMIGGPWAAVGNDRNNLRYLEAIVGIPIRDLQGSKDDPKMVVDLRYCFKRLKSWKSADAELIEFPDLGHSFDFEKVKWGEFLAKTQRNPNPKHVVAMTAGRPPQGHTPGRAFWCEILGTSGGVEEDPHLKITKDKWDSMNDDARRHWASEEAEKKTARLEITMTAPGQFAATSRGVGRFRVLLTDEMLNPKNPSVVTHAGKTTKRAPDRSAAVLLAEFVERFDRTFLPVSEVRVE